MGITDTYNGINNKIGNGIKVVIGLVLIVAAVVIDAVSGFANEYNEIVSVMAAAGMLSFVNALFAKLYKSPLSYILFMAGNIAGLLLYLFVISRYDMIGGLFTGLFSGLVFVVMWLMEMCLITGAGLKKRIFGGLLLNIIVLLAMGISVVAVVAASVVMSMIA